MDADTPRVVLGIVATGAGIPGVVSGLVSGIVITVLSGSEVVGKMTLGGKVESGILSWYKLLVAGNDLAIVLQVILGIFSGRVGILVRTVLRSVGANPVLGIGVTGSSTAWTVLDLGKVSFMSIKSIKFIKFVFVCMLNVVLSKLDAVSHEISLKMFSVFDINGSNIGELVSPIL